MGKIKFIWPLLLCWRSLYPTQFRCQCLLKRTSGSLNELLSESVAVLWLEPPSPQMDTTWRPPNGLLPSNVTSEIETAKIDGLVEIGFYQLCNTPNSYGNVLERIFCTLYDEVELNCPAPPLCRGFGSTPAHHPVDFNYSMSTHSQATPSAQNDENLSSHRFGKLHTWFQFISLICGQTWKTIARFLFCHAPLKCLTN